MSRKNSKKSIYASEFRDSSSQSESSGFEDVDSDEQNLELLKKIQQKAERVNNRVKETRVKLEHCGYQNFLKKLNGVIEILCGVFDCQEIGKYFDEFATENTFNKEILRGLFKQMQIFSINNCEKEVQVVCSQEKIEEKADVCDFLRLKQQLFKTLGKERLLFDNPVRNQVRKDYKSIARFYSNEQKMIKAKVEAQLAMFEEQQEETILEMEKEMNERRDDKGQRINKDTESRAGEDLNRSQFN